MLALLDHLSSKKLFRLELRSAAIGLFVTALATGCGLEKPKAPNWTVDLLMPIANRHVDGPYIASHAGTDYLTWANDSGLVWKIVTQLDTVLLGDNLRTTPPEAGGLFYLGSVVIGEDNEVSCRIDLDDVTPLSAGTIPELTTSITAPFQAATSFDSLAGGTGLLRLEIENELGVAVDQVTVTLSTNGTSQLASILVPGTIASGMSQTVAHQISNLTCGNDWTATLAFHTPGGTVLSASDKFIAIHASFPQGISATFARAVVGQTMREYSDTLVLSQTHQLSSATISSGQIHINWTNTTSLPLTVNWQSQDLLDNGLPLRGEATFGVGGSSSVSIDMEGVNYVSSGPLSSARIAITVLSSGSNGQTVQVADSQSIEYELSWSELTFSSATGSIAQTQFSTGTHTATLTWDNGLEAAGLDTWDAYLVVTSSLPLSAQIDGLLTTNTGLNMPVSGMVGAAASGVSRARILLHHDDESLLPLPSQVGFAGTVTIGGGNNPVSLAASDFVSAAVEFSAPAHMYVDDVSISIDPSSVSLAGEDFGDRTNRLVNAIVTITVANRFPLGGEFTLRMASDSGSVNSDGALAFGPSTLAPAATDGSGNATAVTTTELSYTLDSADLTLFEREVIWFSESLTLLGPGQGQPARISPEDALDWNANARIEYRIDSDVRPWEK